MYQLRPSLFLFFVITSVACFSACKDSDKRSESANIEETDSPKVETPEIKNIPSIASPSDLAIDTDITLNGTTCTGSLSLSWSSEAENTKTIIYTSSSKDGHTSMDEMQVTESPLTQDTFDMTLDEERKFYIQLISTENEENKSQRIEFPQSLICANKDKKAMRIEVINNPSADKASADLIVDQQMLSPESGTTLGYFVSDTEIDLNDEALDWISKDIISLDPSTFEPYEIEENLISKKDIVTKKDENKFLYILMMKEPEKNITLVHYQAVSFETEPKVDYEYNKDKNALNILLTRSLAMPPGGITSSTIGYAISETPRTNIAEESRADRSEENRTDNQKWFHENYKVLSASSHGCVITPGTINSPEKCIQVKPEQYQTTPEGLYKFFDIATKDDQGKLLYIFTTQGNEVTILDQHVINFEEKPAQAEPEPVIKVNHSEPGAQTASCYQYGSCKTK